MQNRIVPAALGPLGSHMADAIAACVHCGFCLPTCPTYRVLGEEMDSPRGRISLIKGVLEGELEAADAAPYIDRCLGCQACVTACPSGVEYGDLLAAYRTRPTITPGERLPARLRLLVSILARPRLLGTALRLAPIGRALRRFLPPDLASALDLSPRRFGGERPRRGAPAAIPPPPSDHRPRARVVLLLGCAQQVLAPEISRAAIRVLTRNGIEVVTPAGQGCCGALAWHAGEAGEARRLARCNLRVFRDLESFDAALTTAAGCGSGMRDYPAIFADLPESEAARALAEKTLDIAVFLERLGIAQPPGLDRPLRAVYHDACHLAHAQGVRSAPRSLLRAVDGLELIEAAHPEICCGSAGTYNLQQPAIAAELGQQKAGDLEATGADLIASGNLGCSLQIQRYLDGGRPMPILHPIEILDRAYRQQPLA